MGLKDKVNRLRKKVPREPEAITLQWIDPETGECLWATTLSPSPDKRGYVVTEYPDGLKGPGTKI
jgi:hypothetical protein